MKSLLTVLLVSLLVGCGTNPKITQQIIDANAAQAKIQTVSLKCPAGCEFSYTDPRDRKSIPLPTNGWDALKSVGTSAISIIPGVANTATMGWIATEGFKSFQGNSTVTNNTTTNSSSTNTESTSNVTSTSTDSNNSYTDSNNNTLQEQVYPVTP